MAKPRPRAPRLDPASRRRQLLDATLSAAVRDGFSELTVDAVAREAGVTRPVVYDGFGSFAGLLEALIDDAEERALGAVLAALPELSGDVRPDAVLSQAVAAFLAAVAREPQLWRLLLTPVEGTPSEVRDRYREHRATVIAHVASLLDWWVGQVEALAGLDTTVMARTMIAVFEDATRLSLAAPGEYPAERFAEGAGQLARLVPVSPP